MGLLGTRPTAAPPYGVSNRTHRLTRSVAFGSLLCAVTCSRASVDEPPVPPIVLPGEVVWSAAVVEGGMIPVADSTRVYFGGRRSVSAVDIRTGAVVWRSATPGLGIGSGALALAGDVLVRADGEIYAHDRATGALRWSFAGTFDADPNWGLLDSDGATIYAAGPIQGHVYAIAAATGVARWDVSVATDTSVQTKAVSPKYYRDTIYVGVRRGTSSGGLAALDARTGRKLWHREFTASRPFGSAYCSGDVAFFGDLVIATSFDGQIIAMRRSDGAVQWTVPAAEEPGSSASDTRRGVTVSGGVVVANSWNELIYAYDATDGHVLWKNSQFGHVGFSGLAADDSTVFMSGAGGQVFAIKSRSGELRWTWQGEVFSAFTFSARPGLDRDFVYTSGLAHGWKLRK